MSKPIAIRVNNLHKKFLRNRHRSGTLREAITESTKRFLEMNRMGSAQLEDFWALRGLSFEITQGEVVGIIGRNGAGKSTLLKILARISPPTKGEIDIEGRLASMLEVGIGFHHDLSGRDNVFINAALMGMKQREVKARIDDIVEFAGLTEFIDTPMKRYSTGMIARLGFAILAHIEADILLVDEVLSVGDADFQRRSFEKMEEKTKEGKTVIFVSHQLAAMRKLCNRCIYLEEGRIARQGNPDQVIDYYLGQVDQAERSATNYQASKDEPVYFSYLGLATEQSQIKFTDEILIRGNIRVNQRLSNIQVCMAMLDRYGERVFSSIRNLEEPMLFPGNEIPFEVTIPRSIIAPNHYSFLFQLYLPPGVDMFDEVAGVLPVRIVDTGTQLAQYENHGRVIIPCEWEMGNQNV